MGGDEGHVVGNYGLGEAFEGERANLFGHDASVECDVNTLTEQNLAVFGLRTEPCRNVAHSANSGIAGPL